MAAKRYGDQVTQTAADVLQNSKESSPSGELVVETESEVPSWLGDLLEKTYLEAWVLALVFGAVEEFRAGRTAYAILCGLLSAALQIVIARWARVKAQFPAVGSRLHLVATDPRWWIATLMFFMTFLAVSPFVEQRRWPFLWQFARQPDTPIIKSVTVREPPSEVDIAAATAPLNKQISQLTIRLAETASERDRAKAESQTLNKQLSVLSEKLKNTPVPSSQTQIVKHAPPSRVILPFGPQYFFDQTKNNSSADAIDKFLKPYLGRWVFALGTVERVEEIDATQALRIYARLGKDPLSFRYLVMEFPQSAGDRVINYKVGDEIWATCQIKSMIDGDTMKLANCELQ